MIEKNAGMTNTIQKIRIFKCLPTKKIKQKKKRIAVLISTVYAKLRNKRLKVHHHHRLIIKLNRVIKATKREGGKVWSGVGEKEGRRKHHDVI